MIVTIFGNVLNSLYGLVPLNTPLNEVFDCLQNNLKKSVVFISFPTFKGIDKCIYSAPQLKTSSMAIFPLPSDEKIDFLWDFCHYEQSIDIDIEDSEEDEDEMLVNILQDLSLFDPSQSFTQS